MNKIRFLVLSIFLTFSSQLSAVTAESIASSVMINNLVDNLKESISSIIDQLNDNVSARSFQIRSDLINIKDELEQSSINVAGKTFGELNNSQRIFFEKTRNNILLIEESLKSGTYETKEILTQVEQIAAQIPTFGEEPRVRNIHPRYLLSQEGDGSAQIRINGSFLRHSDNASFTILGKSCEKVEHTDSLIKFNCPKSIFKTEKTVSYLSGSLDIGDDPSTMQKLKSFFGQKSPRKNYNLSFAVIPKTLGEYKVDITYQENIIERSNREGEWGFTNTFCTGPRTRTYSFSPQSAGWKIDVNTINHKIITCDRRCSLSLKNVSANGFQVEASTRNTGACLKDPFTGGIISSDGRGCCSGKARWVDTKVTPTQKTITKKTGTLEWNKDITIKTPENLIGFTLYIRQINGKDIALHSATDDEWVSISRDTSSTSLIIKPKSLRTALD